MPVFKNKNNNDPTLEAVAMVTGVRDIAGGEITVRIGSVEVTGVSATIPATVERWKSYEVTIRLDLQDGWKFIEQKTRRKSIAQLADSMQYVLKGQVLRGGVLDCGMLIKDHQLAKLEPFQGRWVEMTVDRIRVDFLSGVCLTEREIESHARFSGFCLIYQKNIGDPKCLEITNELINFKRKEYLEEIKKYLHLSTEEVLQICESCPNSDFEWEVVYRRQ